MVDLADAAVVAVLTRAPSSPGKTRLFTSLGIERDPRLLEALLLDTLDGVAADGVVRVVAVTPASARDEVRALLSRLKAAPTHGSGASTRGNDVAALESHVGADCGRPIEESHVGAGFSRPIEVIGQNEGDLGDRMRGVMEALFARGARAVALVGSDVPHIMPSTIAAAFEALARERDLLVLGRAADGGYYLIAATRVPDVFGGIEWGSASVLDQTARAAERVGFRLRLLDCLADVDTSDDLRTACGAGRARRTSAWLRRHDAGE